VDPRFQTQAGIYAVLEQADAVPGVLDAAIGEWLAWPAIKVLIYARLFNALDDAPMALPSAKRVFRGASLGSRLPSTWLRLRSAMGALPPRSQRPRVAWLSGSYARRGVDGVTRDALFGDLPAELAPHAEQLWLQPPLLTHAADGVHAESIYEIATDWGNQLTALQRFRPAVRAVADSLAEQLTAITADAGGLSWHRVCLDALSTFEARRIAWTTVFEQLHPDIVIMTNAPYLSAQVAAAKTCGAIVAEFQHGLFGPRCPEYGWPGDLASKRGRMPVADKLFVFGDWFRAAALKNGFWRGEDVRATGSAAIERIRRAAPPATSQSATRRLVFLTQPSTRSEAIAFWRQVLTGAKSGSFPDVLLTIKVHPSERDRRGDYAALASEFGSHCRIADPDEDAIQVMLEHDVVVGYTSYGLIEAAGLGRRAISISGTQTPGGVFALCPIPGASAAIPTVSSPTELAALVAQPAANIGQPAAVGFFAQQPPGALLQEMIDLLRSSGRSIETATVTCP
jgi:hypothetical protein